ncbi:beta strand repeat-containing protein [Lactococcus petauri]|uniref:beta strand repeat-containing protein n=2 Tax=Lactococcus petauri TaxID=1940789 RepID=UPI001F57E49E|nr:LPXTG cell wall anchor domain-containing protein [Lactococcus petauri]
MSKSDCGDLSLGYKYYKEIRRKDNRRKSKALHKYFKLVLYALTFFILSPLSPVVNWMPSLGTLSAEASISQQTDGTGITWNLITAGNDINTLATTALPGSTLYIKAANDLTLGVTAVLPLNLTLVFDMGGHALYNTGAAVITPSVGNTITFQNERIVSTGTTNSTTVPSPLGVGTVTGVYNYYYGLFSATNISGVSITYKNVVQDLGTITTWGAGGQPFYNIGSSVNFSGTNYFNYNSGQEFMEGTGINVLDGTTTIKHSSGGNAPLWAQSAASINVAAGATLDFTGSSTGRGFIYLDNTPTFTINNNGTLKLNMAGPSSNNFYSNTGMSSITMNYGVNSSTTITAPGFFDYNATGGAFKTTIGQGASFDYSTGNTSNAFLGTLAATDSFTLNSAKHVRLNTSKTSGSSILGTDASAMPFVLNASSPSAYAINGYNSTGAASLLASPTSGAFGVTGTFHSNLADLNKLTGQKIPTATEITSYQNSAQLEFNLVSPAQANFSYVWAANVPGQNGIAGTLLGQLPARVSEQGTVGGALTAPTLSAAPKGYYISGYKAPNGTIYSTLAAALAAVNNVFGTTSNTTTPDIYMPSTNDFQVILSAEEQTFYINYGYAFTNFGNVPPFPPNAYSQKGLTGAPLAISGLGAAPTGYHYSAVMNNKGSSWIDQTNPETGAANTPTPYYVSISLALTAAITQQNGGMYFGTSSLSAAPIINNQGAFDNNVMAMLTANAEIANYTYGWANITPGYNGNAGQIYGNLPSQATSNGGFGDTIARDTSGINSPGNNYQTFVAPPNDKALSGYSVAVRAPNGITYTSDSNAVASSTVIKTTTPLTTATQANTFKEGAAANNFVITYTPIANKISWHYTYDPSISNPPAAPADIVQTGMLTGAPLTDPKATAPNGYFIEGYQYPGDTKIYPTIAELQTAHFSGTSDITINVLLAKNFVLPYTGGSGQFGIILASATLAFLALAFYIFKRKD